MNYIFRAKKDKQEIIYENPMAFTKALATFKGTFEVVLRKTRSPRTCQQNKAYWGIIVKMLAEELGYEKDDIHYALREKFLSIKEEGELHIPRSTTDLSISEFNTFMADVRQWAAEFLNISIPEPNEVE